MRFVYFLSFLFYSLSLHSLFGQSVPTTTPTAVSPGTVCPGQLLYISADVIDDGRTALPHNNDAHGAYFLNYYNVSTGTVYPFQDFADDYVGTPSLSSAAGVYSASNKIYGPALVPNLPAGTYYVRVSTGTGVNGDYYSANASNSPTFTINAPAVATIAYPLLSKVYVGNANAVRIDFSGTGPFSYSYDNLKDGIQTISNIQTNQSTPYFYPLSTYTFDASKVLNFQGACGVGTVTGSVVLTVIPIDLSAFNLNKSSICIGSNDSLAVSFLTDGSYSPNNFGAPYRVQISDANGDFQNGKIIGTPSVVTNVHGNYLLNAVYCKGADFANFQPGTNYKVRVVPSKNVAGFTVSPTGTTITLNRGEAPTVTNTNPVACQGDSPVQLSATGTNLTWYNSQDQVIAGTPAQPTNVAGNYIYNVTQTVNGCTSDKVTVTVSINGKSPAPGDATLSNYCQGTGGQPLAYQNPPNASWYTQNGTAIGSQPPTVSTDNTSQQVYTVSQNTNGCVSDLSTITVTVKPKPVAPTASNPAALCQYGPSVPLTATGLTLQWYDSNGQSISSPVSPPTTPGNSPIIYKVTQTVDGCQSDPATVTQTFNPASDTPTVSTVSYCINQVAQPLSTLSQQTQNPQWYANGSPISGTTIPATNIATTLVYQLSQTQIGKACPSQLVNVGIVINPQPDPPSVDAISFCYHQEATPLSAVGLGLRWYGQDSSGGTPSSVAPTPPTSTTGTFYYFVSQSINNCESARANIAVTINPIPAAPKVATVSAVCQANPQTLGPFSATPDPNGTLTWFWPDNPAGSPNAPTSTLTAQSGSYTVAVNQTVHGCTSATVALTQTINPAPAPPAGHDLTLCLKDSPQPLVATAATGAILRWYGQSATGGTPANTPPTVTPDRVKSEIYYVSQLDGNGCESLQRAAIHFTVVGTPEAPGVQSLQQICQYAKPIAVSADGNNLIWKGTDVTDTTRAPTPSTSVGGKMYSYTVTQTTGSCVSPPSFITYQILTAPVAPMLTPALLNLCIGQIQTLSATASSTDNTLKWYASQTDAQAQLHPLLNVTVPTEKAQTLVWYVTQTDKFGCESLSALQTARISAQATAQLSGTGQVIYDDNMHAKDSTAIKVLLSGGSPWQLTFWDGSSVSVDSLHNPYTKWVLVKDVAALAGLTNQIGSASATFSLSALAGQCGAGVLPTPYTLTVNHIVTADTPLQPDFSLLLTPNPAATTLQIRWAALIGHKIKLSIMSNTGALVWTGDRVGSGTQQDEWLDVSSLPAGIYFFHINDAAGSQSTYKLVKQ